MDLETTIQSLLTAIQTRNCCSPAIAGYFLALVLSAPSVSAEINSTVEELISGKEERMKGKPSNDHL